MDWGGTGCLPVANIKPQLKKSLYSLSTNIRTYQALLGYLMILGFLWFSLVSLGFPGPFKAHVSYRPILMAVAWL